MVSRIVKSFFRKIGIVVYGFVIKNFNTEKICIFLRILVVFLPLGIVAYIFSNPYCLTTRESADYAFNNKIAAREKFEQKISNRLLLLDGRIPDLIRFDLSLDNRTRVKDFDIGLLPGSANLGCFTRAQKQNDFPPGITNLGQDLTMEKIKQVLEANVGSCQLTYGTNKETAHDFQKNEYCLLLRPTNQSWILLFLLSFAAWIGFLVLIKEAAIFVRKGWQYFE